LRAQLISIGLWITRELEAIRLGKSDNFAGIAQICAIIRDGLK
jgi:flagellar protein FlaF